MHVIASYHIRNNKRSNMSVPSGCPSLYCVGNVVTVDPRTAPERRNSDGGLAFVF